MVLDGLINMFAQKTWINFHEFCPQDSFLSSYLINDAGTFAEIGKTPSLDTLA